MQYNLDNLLHEVTEELEENFDTEEVSSHTLHLHLNFSLTNTLMVMLKSNRQFFLRDEIFDYVEENLGIGLDDQWPKFVRASELTVKQIMQEQRSLDEFFAELEAADSDYEYPVEHWVSHICMRPEISDRDDRLKPIFLRSIYAMAVHECKDWMIYDEEKIAEIEMFVADLITIEA